MKSIIILLFSFPVLLVAQEFSTFLYFETEEGFRDSVKIGYDPEASAGIDDQFGEIDLGESSLRDSIDIRLALPDYDKLDCFQVDDYYDFHIPDLFLQETKVDIIPKDCEQFIFDSLINRPAFFLTLLIPVSNYPLTMSWDSTVFNNVCVDESFFTSWDPGSWFDSGCYGPRIIPVEFKGSNHFELIEPIGIQILNPDLDTLVMLFMSLESSLVVSTKEIDTISDDSPKVFPNPFTTSFTVQSEQGINQVRVYDLDGRLELSTTKLEVQTTNLTPGIKVVEILLENGQRYVEKLVKW